MRYHECDQLASDIIDAEAEMFSEHQVLVHLSIQTLERLVEDASLKYRGDDFESVLETALDTEEPFQNAMQRTGYKKALGKVFGRRGQLAKQRQKEIEARCGTPF